jgi:hypothetical protein
MEYPGGSGVEHLFGGGPWIGAIVDTSSSGAQKRISVVSTGYEGWAGPIQEMFGNPDGRDSFYITSIYSHNGEPNKRFVDDDTDGKIDEDELDGTDNDGDWNLLTDDLGTDGFPDTLEIGCDGGWRIDNPDPAHDNWDSVAVNSCLPGHPLQANRFVHTQGNGFPNHGEPHVDEDYAAVSEQDVYVAYSDAHGNPSPVPGHVPLGLNIWQRSYAWQNQFTSPILPIEFLIVNAGRYTLDSVYVGFVTDFDVGPVAVPGYYSHNSTGYMDDVHLAYQRNSVDQPNCGAGILPLSAGEGPLDSLAFTYSWTATSLLPVPVDPSRYEFMRSEEMRPFDSASVADTYCILSFGPVYRQGKTTMYPGDTLRVVMALIAGDDLRATALHARGLYENNFVTGTERKEADIPAEIALLQNYPNPFNPSTVIRYELSVAGFVTVRVFDVLGREVARPVEGAQSAGEHTEVWNASNLASGVYYYRLEVASTTGQDRPFMQTRKMILLR